MNYAIIFAGGSGKRMKTSAKPKQFLELYGKPIIIYTLEVFENHKEVDNIVIPCIAGWENYLASLLKKYNITKVSKILKGGANTQESKMNALNHLKNECKDNDVVIVHDAVRPLVTEKMISDNLQAVKDHGSAISVVPFSETGIVSHDRVSTKETIIRNTLFIAKAPQSFYFKDLYDAHEKGQSMDPAITIDTCSLMTELGYKLHLVSCDTANIKITNPEDYFLFKALVDWNESQEVFGL